MTRSNIIDVEVTIHYQTERTVLVKAVWLPISQIELDEAGETAVVTLPEWLATERGLT